MTKNFKIGDRVLVDKQYQAAIINIRTDSNGVKLYDLVLGWENGPWVARDCELENL